MAITPAQKKALLKIKGMKALKAEFDKQMKKVGGNGRMKGRGSDFWKKLGDNIVDIDEFLKKTKLISKAGTLATAILPFTPAGPGAAALTGAVTAGANALGYGYGKKLKASLKPMPVLTTDGRFSKTSLPTRPAVVVGRGQGRSIRQGVFNTVSSEFGKMKF